MLTLFARSAALFVAVALAAGCSGTTSTSQSTATAAASDGTASSGAAGGTIKIGIDLPVSGADASTGIPTRNGAVMAIEEANATAPSGFKFAAYDLDDAVQGAHDPAQGANNTRQCRHVA